MPKDKKQLLLYEQKVKDYISQPLNLIFSKGNLLDVAERAIDSIEKIQQSLNDAAKIFTLLRQESKDMKNPDDKKEAAKTTKAYRTFYKAVFGEQPSSTFGEVMHSDGGAERAKPCFYAEIQHDFINIKWFFDEVKNRLQKKGVLKLIESEEYSQDLESTEKNLRTLQNFSQGLSGIFYAAYLRSKDSPPSNLQTLKSYVQKYKKAMHNIFLARVKTRMKFFDAFLANLNKIIAFSNNLKEEAEHITSLINETITRVSQDLQDAKNQRKGTPPEGWTKEQILDLYRQYSEIDRTLYCMSKEAHKALEQSHEDTLKKERYSLDGTCLVVIATKTFWQTLHNSVEDVDFDEYVNPEQRSVFYKEELPGNVDNIEYLECSPEMVYDIFSRYYPEASNMRLYLCYSDIVKKVHGKKWSLYLKKPNNYMSDLNRYLLDFREDQGE